MAVFNVLIQTSAKYTATLKDEDGTVIPRSDIADIKVTLYNLDDSTGSIINSRDDQTVFDSGGSETNGGTLHATSGLFTLNLTSSDNVMVDSTQSHERHRMVINFTWDSPVKTGRHVVDFVVRNLEKVT